jgi:SAM-dependent methyltransferase
LGISLPCPACGGALWVDLYRGVRDFEHGLPVRADFDACPACGLVVQVPPPQPSALATYYPADYRPHVGGPSLVARLKALQASLQLRRLAKFLPGKDEPILELGCGAGHFVRALDRAGYTNLTAIDRTLDLGRAFEGTKIRYRAVDLDQSRDIGGPWAAIAMNYVIEHFADPAAVLRACRGALAPGGRVLLLTPNSRSLSHRMFGRYWSGLHAPRHTQIFAPDNLALVARKAGFSEVDVVPSTDPASWTLSFQNLVSGRAPHAGTAWYSMALLPAWYPFAIAERLMGRASSMFGVLRA